MLESQPVRSDANSRFAFDMDDRLGRLEAYVRLLMLTTEGVASHNPASAQAFSQLAIDMHDEVEGLRRINDQMFAALREGPTS